MINDELKLKMLVAANDLDQAKQDYDDLPAYKKLFKRRPDKTSKQVQKDCE